MLRAYCNEVHEGRFPLVAELLRAARLMSDTSRLDVLALWNSHSTARNAPDASFHRILGNAAVGWQ
jgi:hypothetical protein